MDYEYDIFISYRRDDLTRKWINDHFVPLIKLHIKLELGRDIKIYTDEKLENGTHWPTSLGKALGASRVIIPLWTKMYLNSIWCSCEIGHMLERESKNGYRTFDKPGGLVFPTIIHDGETMPVQLSTIQKLEIQDCFNVRMSSNSQKAEILEDKLKPLGKDIASAIATAPIWREDWQSESVDSFLETYYISVESSQNQLPKFTS